MWTATIISIVREHGRLVVEIKYTKGNTVISKRYNLERATRGSIKKLARGEVSKFENLQNEVINLQPGDEIDLSPVPPPPPAPPPTPPERARADWFADWGSLQPLLRLADAGIISVTDQRITDLQTSLINDWLDNYLDGII